MVAPLDDKHGDPQRATADVEAAEPGQVPKEVDDTESTDNDENSSDDSPNETRRQRMVREYQALKPFVIISATYLLFTVTDGGVRTIVLFNALARNFTSFQVSLMFVLYELAGVVTNFLAGIAGARWGIKSTLLVGLAFQVLGLGMLYGWQESFSTAGAIIFVTVAQMLSGIAKDLVKIPGKTVTKLVTPDEKQGRLFKLVSLITGWKNSLKGVGYFLGGALVRVNYYLALSVMLLLTFAAVPWALLSLSRDLGQTRRENISWRSILKKNYNINRLSLARLFLFGSRDAWFEVPLPFFLRSMNGGLGWEAPAASAFLGGWIILYGQVQSYTPQLVSRPLRQYPANKYSSLLWVSVSVVTPLVLGSFMQFSDIFGDSVQAGMVAVLVVGLVAFAVVFAINSSIHSYLVVKYSEGDKVSMNVGFYYMSNAAGRLFGTLAGGALYSFVGGADALDSEGLAACFWLSCFLIVVTAVVTIFIDDQKEGLQCGPCLTCIAPVEEDENTKDLGSGDEGEDDEEDEPVVASSETARPTVAV
eukprot:Plantae.Rhodophyta-Rhodochaete_pulchella.ctg247.p1 GENE.Plantae.Rhodophyta-Rhodochaete_pulchella.ctg247~~Plantae.Rhodophyta-Rhodochaete_pulchella.ctg247.p1  ORF type:complete len:533 (+),score=86.92 Plantae.Rhodophyta-Rhodochaete_pulchella.ctg247:1179-2777(+)